MLAVILGILKVIGTVLLVILCIVLALILLVLFWPVCYNGSFQKHGKEMHAEGRVWWLMHAVHASGSFSRQDGKNKTQGEVRLFGIPLLRLMRKHKDKQKTSAKTSKKMPAGRKADGSAKKKPTVQPGQWKYYPDASKENESVQIKTEIYRRKKPGFFTRLGAKIGAFAGKIKKFFAGLKEKKEELEDWLAYLGSESFAAAKNGMIGAVKKILSHILPRKIRGKIDYGMEDPALTGEILAVIAVFYPVLPKGLSIVPDFENFDANHLEADVQAKGHIFLFYILFQVIKLILMKDFRDFLKRLKALKNKKK